MGNETGTQCDVASNIGKINDFFQRGQKQLMDFANNRLQWNYYPYWRKLPEFPLNIDIEASSYCNLKCNHCFRQYMDMKEKHYMDMDLYKKLIDECGRYGLYTLKFSMRGEPTLHPEIIKMVSYAKEKGIKEVWINTHGGQLTPKLAEGLIDAGLDWLTVSFDGLGEIYESIRIPLKYDESIEKLKMFREVRDRKGRNKPVLKVQTLWSAIRHDPDEYISVMTPIVDKISYNPDMNFKNISLIPDPDFVCPRLWQRIAITSEGDMLRCPSDFEKDNVLGNIKNRTIKSFWDDEQEKVRKKHLAGRKDEDVVCRKCHHGAKKVGKVVEIGGKKLHAGDYSYSQEFKGHGLAGKK